MGRDIDVLNLVQGGPQRLRFAVVPLGPCQVAALDGKQEDSVVAGWTDCRDVDAVLPGTSRRLGKDVIPQFAEQVWQDGL